MTSAPVFSSDFATKKKKHSLQVSYTYYVITLEAQKYVNYKKLEFHGTTGP